MGMCIEDVILPGASALCDDPRMARTELAFVTVGRRLVYLRGRQ